MWPREAELYPPLDLSLDDAPPRSRLFALPPAGLGTDRVEGLASYITRLARAHAVRPRSLIRVEFVKACRSPEQLRFAARHSRDVRTMDGLGAYAEAFAGLTAELTTVPAVRHLTLLPLAKLLPRTSAGVIAAQSRWCPDCLAGMAEKGVDEVARPLVWSLELYRACHRHRRWLVASCSRCGKVQPFMPLLPDLVRCPYCGAPLSDGRHPAATPAPTETDIRIAEMLADLVAHLPDLDGIATRERFIAFLKSEVSAVAASSRVGFCEQVGLRRWAIKNWLTRGQRPSLPQLVSLALGTGISVPAMFGARCDREVPPSPSGAKAVRSRSQRPLLGKAQRDALAATLAGIVGNPADNHSMAEVARALGISCSSLRYWFPDASASIRAKHAKAKQEAVRQRREIEYRAVGQMVGEIAGRGEYPGRRKVNEALAGLHLSLAKPDMMAAYRKALQEHVGLELAAVRV